MSETRKIAAILVADVVGYSRLAGADEDRTLSRLRGLRSDLIDPAIGAHYGADCQAHHRPFRRPSGYQSAETLYERRPETVLPTPAVGRETEAG